jgi:hypothetical protein
MGLLSSPVSGGHNEREEERYRKRDADSNQRITVGSKLEWNY